MQKNLGKTLLPSDSRTHDGSANIIYTLVLVRNNDMAIYHPHFILNSNYYIWNSEICFPDSYYDLLSRMYVEFTFK